MLDIGNFTRAGLSYVRDTGGKLSSGPVGRAARVAGHEISGLGGDSWREVRRSGPKRIGDAIGTIAQVAIIGGAAALMGHLIGPVIVLGTMVGAFAPLAKIARELARTPEATEAEPVDDADTPDSDSPDDAAAAEQVAPRTKAKVPARTRPRRKR